MNRKIGLIVGAVVILAVAGGLYAWKRSAKTMDGDLKVMVNGKEVDPKTVQIKGLDGKPIDLATRIDPRAAMGQMVDDYFKLPAGPQRNAYLDKMIDQQEKMKTMMSGDGHVRMTAGPTTGPTTQPNQTVMVRRTGGSGGGNPMDNMPPELTAKVAEMVSAMNKRRAERGLPPGPAGIMIMRTGEGKVMASPVGK